MNSSLPLVCGSLCIVPMVIAGVFFWLGTMVGARRIQIQTPIQFKPAQPRQTMRPQPVKPEDRIGYGKPQ